MGAAAKSRKRKGAKDSEEEGCCRKADNTHVEELANKADEKYAVGCIGGTRFLGPGELPVCSNKLSGTQQLWLRLRQPGNVRRCSSVSRESTRVFAVAT